MRVLERVCEGACGAVKGCIRKFLFYVTPEGVRSDHG